MENTLHQCEERRKITLFEVEEAAEVIRSSAKTEMNTIFGAVINENLNDEVIVTVIATGFDKKGKLNLSRKEVLVKEKIKDVKEETKKEEKDEE